MNQTKNKWEHFINENEEEPESEKTTAKIIGTRLDRKEDIEAMMTRNNQKRLLYTIILIILIVIMINTYMW